MWLRCNYAIVLELQERAPSKAGPCCGGARLGRRVWFDGEGLLEEGVCGL